MVVVNRELFYDGCRPGVKVFIRYADHTQWEARILVRQATTAVYRRVNRESPSANAFLFWAVTPDFGEYPEDLSLNDDVVGLIRPVDAWWPRRNLDQGFGIGDLTCLDDVYDFRSVVEPGRFMEIMQRCLAVERTEVMRKLRHLQEPGFATLAPIAANTADELGVITGQGSMPRAYAEWKVIGSTDSSAVGTVFMQDVDFFCVVQGGAIALQGKLCYLLMDTSSSGVAEDTRRIRAQDDGGRNPRGDDSDTAGNARRSSANTSSTRGDNQGRYVEPPRPRPSEPSKDSFSSRDSLFSGTVKKYFDDKGFGFVSPDGGSRDVFAHVRDNPGLQGCRKGDAVKYDLQWDPLKRKYKAVGLILQDSNRFGQGEDAPTADP